MPKKVDEKVIPDYEAMQICIGLDSNRKNVKAACKVIYQTALGNRVNLFSCISISKIGAFKIVTKAATNNRQKRKRAASNSKDAPMLLSGTDDSQNQFFVK